MNVWCYISQQQIKMERSSTGTEVDDEDVVQAVVKAAAWAWYELGGASLSTSSGSSSGSTTKVSQQVSTRRRRRRSPQPQPSRFKLEAINKMIQQPQPPPDEEEEEDEQNDKKSSSNYSSLQLLDAYEIERISKHLESLLIITSSSTSRGSGVEAANSTSSSRWWGAKQQIMSSPSSPTKTRTAEIAAPAATNMVDRRSRDDAIANNKDLNRSRGWLGLVRHNGRICGVNEENRMVKTVLVHQHRRRKPENHI